MSNLSNNNTPSTKDIEAMAHLGNTEIGKIKLIKAIQELLKQEYQRGRNDAIESNNYEMIHYMTPGAKAKLRSMLNMKGDKDGQ